MMNHIAVRTKINYKIWLSILVFLFYATAVFFMNSWKGSMTNGDTSGYYLHTTSLFLYHDVGDYSKSLEAFFQEYPSQRTILDDPYWMKESSTGKRFVKYSLGVSVMEAPAFMIAHMVAKLVPAFEANGYSPPYVFAINFSQVIFLTIALYLLALCLEIFFRREVVIWTIIAISLGTNLFIQTTYLTIAHVFLFFCFSLLTYLSIRFYKLPSVTTAVSIGAVVGLIALIRIPEVTCFLIPLFWGVYNRKTLSERIHLVKTHWSSYLYAMVTAVVIFSPQVWYWYYTSGSLITNPYEGEGFNFWEPHIYNGWFSYQNGWLVYSPIMFLGLLGIPLLYRKAKAASLPLVFFVGLNTWIHYSYYTWNYYPGMGSRPMIESYPLLAFAMGSLLALAFRKLMMKYLLKFMIVAFIGLNLLQSWQFRQGILWTARANKAYYWELFGSIWPDQQTLRAFDANEPQPTKVDLQLEKQLFLNDYEKLDYASITQNHSKSGRQALHIQSEFPDTLQKFNFGEFGILPGDYLFVSCWAYRHKAQKGLSRDDLESLVLRIYDTEGKEVNWANVKIANHINNPENKPGNFNTIRQWGEAGFFVQIPNSADSTWYAEILFWNPKKSEIFVDDLKLELYRKK